MVDLILEFLNVSYVINFFIVSVVLFVGCSVIIDLSSHGNRDHDKEIMRVMPVFLSMIFSFILTIFLTSVDLSNVPHQSVSLSYNSGRETLMFDVVYNSHPNKFEKIGLAKIQRSEFKVACYKKSVKECVNLIESNVQELVNGSNVDDLTASL